MLRVVAQRMVARGSRKLFPPVVQVLLAGVVTAQRLKEVGGRQFDAPGRRVPVLADLGRVDVDVDDLGLRGEGVQLPVTWSSSGFQRDEQVRCRAATAATVPCIPGMPRFCGWLSGKAPAPSAW